MERRNNQSDSLEQFNEVYDDMAENLGIPERLRSESGVRNYVQLYWLTEQLQSAVSEGSQSKAYPEELVIVLRDRLAALDLLLAASTQVLRSGLGRNPDSKRYIRTRLSGAVGRFGLAVVDRVGPYLHRDNSNGAS